MSMDGDIEITCWETFDQAELNDLRERIEDETLFMCNDCEQVHEEGEEDTVYECPECSDQFLKSDTGSHRSECCGRFSSKVTEVGCPDCMGEMARIMEVPENEIRIDN